MKNVFLREQRGGGEAGHRKIEAEISILQLQAEECIEPPEAGRA